MVFLKKSFALGAIVALFASAAQAAREEDEELLEPLRTHSIYMPYIGKERQEGATRLFRDSPTASLG